MQYSEMSKEELLTLQAELNQQYAEAKAVLDACGFSRQAVCRSKSKGIKA